MRKTLMAPALACALLLSLSACSSDKEADVKPAPTTQTSVTPGASPTTTPSTPSEEASPTPSEEASEDNSSLDAQFASFMKEQVPGLANVSDKEIVKEGKGFCSDFTATSNVETLKGFITDLQKKYGLEPYDAGVFAGAATGAYCKDMTPQLREAATSLG